MMANTKEMMRVQEKRADRDDKSLKKTQALCNISTFHSLTIENIREKYRFYV